MTCMEPSEVCQQAFSAHDFNTEFQLNASGCVFSFDILCSSWKLDCHRSPRDAITEFQVMTSGVAITSSSLSMLLMIRRPMAQ